MRVLLDGLQAANRSGTGSYTQALIRELPNSSSELDLHVTQLPGVSTADDSNLPHTFHPCSSRRPPIGTIERNIGFMREIRRLDPDVIHYPANFTRSVGRRGSDRARIVLTVHDLSFLRHPRWFKWHRSVFYRSAIGRSVRAATRILADSECTSQDLQEFLNVDPARIDVTPLGVDDRFRPASQNQIEEIKTKYDFPDAFFLYVGTLEPRKNLPRLIEAWDKIADNAPFDLVIAGRKGWKTESIFRAAGAARHAARIHFPGFIESEDLPAVLSAADVFAWPSLWEGFGLPPLEAMACGTPVLTSNTSSIPEVVGESALTVTPEDTEAIAQALAQLAGDETLRTKLSEAGRARASEFTWKRTAQLTCAAYRRALEMDWPR